MKAAAYTLLLSTFAITELSAAPPATKRHAVTDTYHGTAVVDEYRWLEDWHNNEVRRWSDAQNAYAREFLDKLPHRDEIRVLVTRIMSAPTVSFSGLSYRGGKLFAIVRQPPKQQPFLVKVGSFDMPSDRRMLVDPAELDPKGGTSIDWYVPSPDGTLVAVSLSRGGSEAGDVHFFSTETGKAMHEIIPRVNTGTAGGDLAWLPDGSGVFYTRHPAEGERPAEDRDFYQQAYFHKLGTPTSTDRYEIGKDFPRVAEIEFEMHDATGTLLLTLQNGDGGEFAHYRRSNDGKWIQLSKFADRVLQMSFAPDGELYLVSRAGADRGKVLRLPLSEADIQRATTVIPEGADTVVTSFYHAPSSVVPTATKLYVVYQLGGPSELRVFDRAGKRLENPAQLPLSTTGGLTKLDDDDVLFSNTSFIEPLAYYRFRAATGKTEKTVLATPSPVDFSGYEVIREFATSKDGTKVPVNIILKKGLKRDGSHPALLTGYGGYGISISPAFNAARHVLLERGLIHATANLRGGGEYGDPWHKQGALTAKQNVFDDFTAVMRHLVERGYTSPAKLAIEGGSNGGLLMGAILTQYPDLMRAVVSHVGIYDMLRVELSPNGAFNVVEFGTVKDAAQFKALFAYSPYHHVKQGTKYPATLFLTGANDPRVDPMQSRKMTALLQERTGGDAPILLRTSADSGHGMGTALSERIEQTVDVYSFLFNRLGVSFQTP